MRGQESSLCQRNSLRTSYHSNIVFETYNNILNESQEHFSISNFKPTSLTPSSLSLVSTRVSALALSMQNND